MKNAHTHWIYSTEDRISPILKGLEKRFGNLERHAGRAEHTINDALDGNSGALEDFTDVGTHAMDDVSMSTGGLTDVIGGIPGPVQVAGAALTVMAGIAGKALKQAGDFQMDFDPLEDLNQTLGQTKEEIAELQEDVLDSSWDLGFDTSQIIQGYYDIQSITGLTGDTLEDLTNRIGEFSRGFNADFNTSIAGAASWLDNFGESATNIDQYMEGVVKAVKVGKSSIEEIMEVSPEFFGAGAAKGQNIDSVLKLYAAISKGSKNAEEAATLTHGALEGLGDQGVIDGLAGIGIQVFDPLTQDMRQMDGIVEDMVRRFKGMSGVEFARVRESIGGPDGMRSLLDKARGSGENLLATFREYSNTDVDINKEIAESKELLNQNWEIIQNKFNVAFTKLGMEILPVVTDAMRFVSELMDALAGRTEGVSSAASTVADVMSFVAEGWAFTWEYMTYPVEIIYDAVMAVVGALQEAWEWLVDVGDSVASFFGFGGDEEITIGDQAAAARNLLDTEVSSMAGTEAYKSGDTQAIFDDLVYQAQQAGGGEALDKIVDAVGGQEAVLEEIGRLITPEPKDPLTGVGMAGELAAEGRGHWASPEEKAPGGRSGNSGKPTGKTEMISTGGGIKNITINIQKVIGIDTVSTTTFQNTPEQAGNAVLDEVLRALNDTQIMDDV